MGLWYYLFIFIFIIIIQQRNENQAGSREWFNIWRKKNDYYERPCWVILAINRSSKLYAFMLSCANNFLSWFFCMLYSLIKLSKNIWIPCTQLIVKTFNWNLIHKSWSFDVWVLITLVQFYFEVFFFFQIINN